MFNIGDEVICIKQDECPYCGAISPEDEIDIGLPEIGKHYIVSRLGMGVCGSTGCSVPLLSCVGYESDESGWMQSSFRKLQFDEDPPEEVYKVKEPELEKA